MDLRVTGERTSPFVCTVPREQRQSVVEVLFGISLQRRISYDHWRNGEKKTDGLSFIAKQVLLEIHQRGRGQYLNDLMTKRSGSEIFSALSTSEASPKYETSMQVELVLQDNVVFTAKSCSF